MLGIDRFDGVLYPYAQTKVQWLGLPHAPRHSRITRRNGAFPHKNSASYARIRFLMKSDVHTAELFCQDCTDIDPLNKM